MQYQSATSSPQMGRSYGDIAKLVCKRLVFWIRLVLYWPPIGPHTKQKGIGVSMNIRRSTLIGTAVAFALYHQSASAQTVIAASATAAADAEEIDEVVVTGIRASLQKSLDVKRNADARLEVVTAEDVGKLPAHNVADALRGLPGVNISSSSADEGGFDESDRVSLRGTSPSLTQTLINGHSVGSADWFVLRPRNNVHTHAMPRKFRAASSRAGQPAPSLPPIRTWWVCRSPASSEPRCSNRCAIARAACWNCSSSLQTT